MSTASHAPGTAHLRRNTHMVLEVLQCLSWSHPKVQAYYCCTPASTRMSSMVQGVPPDRKSSIDLASRDLASRDLASREPTGDIACPCAPTGDSRQFLRPFLNPLKIFTYQK